MYHIASHHRLRRFTLAFLAASLCATAANAAASRASSIIVDANSGKVMQELAPDAPRFPASITKVMTLYLLFEQLEAKRLTLDSKLNVSSFAAQKPPSKLGVKPGSQIRVEDAIMALVTRSANDVATVIAENIAGSEYSFAQLMTRKARMLGMVNTTFKNASGLPDPQQQTTARDLAQLGRAMYERFPAYTPYFSRTVFAYKGARIGNHNRLLGRVRGVDGIKTGYTNASGFNLLTSAHLDGRHVIGVVMGGATGGQRDARMASLLATYMPRATSKKIVDKELVARIFDKKTVTVASRDEVKKVPEKTFAQSAESLEKAAGGKALALAPSPAPRNSLAEIVAPAIAAAQDDAIENEDDTPSQLAAESVEGDGMRWNVGARSTVAAKDETVTASLMPSVPASVMPNGQPAARGKTAAQPSRLQAMQSAPETVSTASQTGWIVQIAAAPTESGAMKMLSEAKNKTASMPSEAKPFTERVVKGNATLYRARFGGFAERSTADAACAALKKNSYSCLTIRL